MILPFSRQRLPKCGACGGFQRIEETVPRRDDIHKILIIGSGPIIIGQACEFDYSGTQACKALREEGYEVVLVNSNPATIMTDPNTADRTYIEPLTWEVVAKVIERERPDALLPTLGGQTGLNTAWTWRGTACWREYGVEMIGANAAVIAKAEEREQFKEAMERIGLEVCRGEVVRTLDAARDAVTRIGLPCVVRPSFTLGGSGSSVAYNREEFDSLVRNGLDQSPISEVLIEESVIGWKEFEMEVMRDMDDNVVIICSIENFDPMGVHTGDSITVAPAPNADRPRVPADARRQHCGHSRDRRRDGGVEHPVRYGPLQRQDADHRDESAGQPLQCVGLEGNRLSHRQNRGQAGRRLPPARAAQRHHAKDAGVLRADDRLRGDQGPAIRFREVSRGRLAAHHANEKRRRNDGDRPDVQGVTPKGPPRIGGRPIRARMRRQRQVGYAQATVGRGNPG